METIDIYRLVGDPGSREYKAAASLLKWLNVKYVEVVKTLYGPEEKINVSLEGSSTAYNGYFSILNYLIKNGCVK